MKLESALSFAERKCREDTRSGNKYYVVMCKEELCHEKDNAFFVTLFPTSDDVKVASYRYGVRRF